MSISDTDRENFIRFMQQQDRDDSKGWEETRFDPYVTVFYSLETDWLRPYPTTFYVGVTGNLQRREKEHTEELFSKEENREKLLTYCKESATPDQIYNSLAEYGKGGNFVVSGSNCRRAKDCIIASSRSHDYHIKRTELDTIQQKLRGKTPLDEAMYLNQDAPIFKVEVLERESRWIFRKFQEGYNLVNVERFFENMIHELRSRPELDVIKTSFCSPVWDPIISAYCKDRQTLGWYNKH
jgi:hypothetical protein